MSGIFLLLSLVVSTVGAMSTPTNCAVVGVGVLGTSLCRQILESPNFQDCQLTGITKTSTRHDDIRKKCGDSNRLRLITADQVGDERFDNVVFCAPPSGFEDYPGSIKSAVDDIWAGASKGGVFVFTSTGSVYGPGSENVVTETSSLADPTESPRVARALQAEANVRDAGGCCIRLAGLYNLNRGPHNFWLTSDKGVSGGPNGLINMLHYDDAAAACLAALEAGPGVVNGKDFLISDSNPISRKGICESALKNKMYEGYSMPEFKGSDDPLMALGKVYDGSASNKALNWKPRYESFDAFMTQ